MIKLDPEVQGWHQPEMDLYTNFTRNALLNRCTSTAGLAIGTGSTAAIKVVTTFNYLIDGEFKSKTSAEVAFTATTHNIPASASAIQERIFLVEINAAGTLTLNAGAIAVGGAGLNPTPTVGLCVVGSVKVAVAAGATPFVAGTDALSAAHLTVTYKNLGCPPLPSFLAAV